jgi:hypothetical protein
MSEETNGENKEIENEESNIAEFGQKVIRSPKGGAFERLICQHLVLSVSSDPLESISHSCRAALALTREVAEKLCIDKEKVSDILTVCMNLRTAKAEKVEEGAPEEYRIIWSFSEQDKEGFKRYIEPWLHSGIVFSLPHWADNYPEEWKKKKEKMKHYEMVYFACAEGLTPSAFQAMLSGFVSWAYPQTEELNQKVSTQVSPTTYSEILSMFNRFQEAPKP